MSPEILHTVGFSATVWVVIIVGCLLLLAALSVWLWRPLSELVETRRRQVAQQQREAEELLALAREEASRARERAAEVEGEALQRRDALLRDAAVEAERVRREALEEASGTRRQARVEAERLRMQALDAVKREAAELAGMMAERLLAGVLNEERQKAVLDAAVADLQELLAKEERN